MGDLLTETPDEVLDGLLRSYVSDVEASAIWRACFGNAIARERNHRAAVRRSFVDLRMELLAMGAVVDIYGAALREILQRAWMARIKTIARDALAQGRR